MTVSWIASLLVMRPFVMSMSQSQNGSPWSGDVNSVSKKKLKMQPAVGKLTCTAFWDRKWVIPLDFLEPGQTINSVHYIMTLIKLKARTSRNQARVEKNLSHATQEHQAPHQIENHGRHCQSSLNCPTAPTFCLSLVGVKVWAFPPRLSLPHPGR